MLGLTSRCHGSAVLTCGGHGAGVSDSSVLADAGWYDRGCPPSSYLATTACGSSTMVRQVRHLRTIGSLGVGAVSLCLYNWWVWAVWPGRLLSSRDEFFSDLEASGRPHATALSRIDLLAGALLVAALLLRGRSAGPVRRAEWPLLLTFAAASALGGMFPYVCAEGAVAGCRSAEWQLQLNWRQYAHIVVGIIEFGAATGGIALAARRTPGRSTAVRRTFQLLLAVLTPGYPLLGLAYLTDSLGALIEPVFFLCFSAALLAELLEGQGSSLARADRPRRMVTPPDRPGP